jgi:hypothetical protein
MDFSSFVSVSRPFPVSWFVSCFLFLQAAQRRQQRRPGIPTPLGGVRRVSECAKPIQQRRDGRPPAVSPLVYPLSLARSALEPRPTLSVIVIPRQTGINLLYSSKKQDGRAQRFSRINENILVLMYGRILKKLNPNS